MDPLVPKNKKGTAIRWYYTRRKARIASLVGIPVACVTLALTVLILASVGLIPSLTCKLKTCAATSTPPIILSVMSDTLAPTSPVLDFEPTLSPTVGPLCFDRQKGFKDKFVVYARHNREAENYVSTTYVVNMDGSITCELPLKADNGLDWSRDGQTIAVSAGRGTIAIMPVWTQVLKWFDVYSDDYSPAWSPDGTQLLLVESPWIKIRDVNSPDKDHPHDVALPGQTMKDYYDAPAWSPDGNQIAYTDQGISKPHPPNLMVANRDGSNPRLLTTISASSPAWSPDSRYLVFTGGTYYPADGDIYVIAADGSQEHPSLLAKRHDDDPKKPAIITPARWSPDGKYIYFGVSQPDKSPQIMILNLDGTTHATIPLQIDKTVYYIAWSPCVNGTSGPPICN